jgi:hypothetical protein
MWVVVDSQMVTKTRVGSKIYLCIRIKPNAGDSESINYADYKNR